MRFKKFGLKYIIRIDKGEEIVSLLESFCNNEKIKLGSVWGIGAVNKAEIGLFDPETKKYHSTVLNGNFEIAPLHGNITTMDSKSYLHLHVNLGDNDHKSWSGHLNSALVSATCEIIIDSFDGELERDFNSEVGLNTLFI